VNRILEDMASLRIAGQLNAERLPIAFGVMDLRRSRARYVLVTAAVTEDSSRPSPDSVRRTARAPQSGLKSAMADTAPPLESRTDRVATELLTTQRAMPSATPVLPRQHELHSARYSVRPGCVPYRRLDVGSCDGQATARAGLPRRAPLGRTDGWDDLGTWVER
jgi:hypothetical protein